MIARAAALSLLVDVLAWWRENFWVPLTILDTGLTAGLALLLATLAYTPATPIRGRARLDCANLSASFAATAVGAAASSKLAALGASLGKLPAETDRLRPRKGA